MVETTQSPELRQWYKQGVQHLLDGQWAQAETVFRRILVHWPGISEAYHNLGIALQNQMKLQEALTAFDAAMKLRPGYPPTYNDLGITLSKMNRLDEAIAAFRQAVALQPNFAEGWGNLGNALGESGRREEAVEALRHALALRAEFPEVWKNLGNVLREMNRQPEAIDAYRKALGQRPDYSNVWNNLGNLLHEKGQQMEAIAALRRSLSIREDHAPTWNNLAGTLKDVGELDQALAAFDRAVELQPDNMTIQSSRLAMLHYHPAYDAMAIFTEARRWNARFVAPFSSRLKPHDNDASPARRLRVGYVSRDFHRHCIALLISPLLANHDHQRFEIFAYCNAVNTDMVTAKLRGYTDVWRDISKLTDDAAAELVRQDRIDILVDLSLHTAGNRLGVFIRKPVPIQVSWLGYPGGTGMDTIDYRLTDPRLDPLDPNTTATTDSSNSTIDNQQSTTSHIGTQEPHYAERSIRLPDCFWCYNPLAMEDAAAPTMPEPAPLPALAAGGRITFGCLNNFCKVSDFTLKLWSQVLTRVSNSEMVLLCPPGPQRDRTLEKLDVAPERVEFVGYQHSREYLKTYHRIDLCLDTIPYNGHTTTLDSLWMGVPVITLAGPTVVGRAGWSQLHCLGLTELVARTPEEFVQKAVDWSGNLERLADLRAALRPRMEASPLMDAPRFARNVEAAYAQMWQAWVAGRPDSTSGQRSQ